MEISLQPLKPEERNYSYRQSQQLAMQTGFVGSLSGNTDGTEWNGFRKDLNTGEFQTELEDVLKALRSDALKDPSALAAYCKAHPESAFTDHNGAAFGFRADTEQHTFLLRLDPTTADNSITIFCHQTKWLDRNIENARQGIRFIDSRYNDKFRLEDGGKIALTMGYDGEKAERVCRFIDPTHLEVGMGGKANLYHICEFAERMERAGNTYEPVPKEKPSVKKQLEQAKAGKPLKPKTPTKSKDKEVR